MKFIFSLLTIFFFANSAFAQDEQLPEMLPTQNWARASELNASFVNKTYHKKSECEATGETCYDFTGKDPKIHSVVGGKLVIDEVKKAAEDARKAERLAREETRKQRKEVLIKALTEKAIANTLTAQEYQNAIRLLLIDLYTDQ